MLPLLNALLIFTSINHNEAEEKKVEQKRQESFQQVPRQILADTNETGNSTIENPGSINVTSDGFYNGTTTSESYYYTLINSSTTDADGDPSYTIMVTKKIQVYYFTYIQNYSEYKNTQTPTSPYRFVFLHPGILIGGVGGLLFIIGTIYTCCFRKSASINYANYLKNNNDDRSSDSMDNLKKPSRGRAGTKRSQDPDPPQRQKPSAKAKASKKHRH